MAVDLWLLLPVFLIASALYTSVGHGGATAYLAILTLAGFTIDTLSTTVLALNIVAAGIAFALFHHAGHLRPRLFAFFVLTSVPAAYVGGLFPFAGRTQELILAIALGAAALRLLLVPRPPDLRVPMAGAWLWVGAPTLGAALGFVAGAIGIGGGVFLSPILLMLGWTNVKEAGAIASAFIVLNSIAGLAAKVQHVPIDVGFVLPLMAVVAAGAVLGGLSGARWLQPRAVQVLLGVVLLSAALKALVA